MDTKFYISANTDTYQYIPITDMMDLVIYKFFVDVYYCKFQFIKANSILKLQIWFLIPSEHFKNFWPTVHISVHNLAYLQGTNISFCICRY